MRLPNASGNELVWAREKASARPAAHVINDVGMRDALVSCKQQRGSRQGPLCTAIREAAGNSRGSRHRAHDESQ
jgi:hypothetical protein